MALNLKRATSYLKYKKVIPPHVTQYMIQIPETDPEEYIDLAVLLEQYHTRLVNKYKKKQKDKS